MTKTAAKIGERLKRALTVRLILTGIVALSIAVFAATTLALSFHTLRLSKTTDVWAICFLDLEARLSDISRRLIPDFDETLAFLPPGLRPENVPPAVARYVLESGDTARLVEGRDLGFKALTDVGIHAVDELAKWNSVKLHRQRYLVARSIVSPKRTILSFYHHPAIDLPLSKHPSLSRSLVYILNRQGDLLYASSPKLTAVSAQQRVLVQNFITIPTTEGQLELKDSASGLRSYGYFRELPGTNLVLFAETPAEIVEQSVNEVVHRLFWMGTAVLGVALLLAQGTMLTLTRPLRTLGAVAERVAGGDFSLTIKPASFGEVRALGSAFANMIRGLTERDKAIKSLLVEQATKVRLEAQLNVARSIQTSLLPTASDLAASPCELSTLYLPAEEVAGDWFGILSPRPAVCIAAIVDVSGHGAGASLYTAIAAALFEELRQRFQAFDDATYFFEAFNRQLRRYGGGRWSASAQLVAADLGAGTLSVLNAGHGEPLVDTGGGSRRVKGLGSALLGLDDEVRLARTVVPFPVGARCLLYSDGLVERRQGNQRIFGVKRLAKSLDRFPGRVDQAVLGSLVADGNQFAGSAERMDDICLVGLLHAPRAA